MMDSVPNPASAEALVTIDAAVLTEMVVTVVRIAALRSYAMPHA
jgi:hypothetical protein